MDLNFETKDIEKSQVILKITVNKKEIKKEYDSLMAEVQKNANIPGFRKGKVPFSVIESKFKEGILAETANKIIDTAFKETIEKVDKKPIVYSQPKLENFELPNLENDYIFELTYDVYPSFTVDNYKTIEVEKNEVKITNEDIEDELQKYLKEFSTIEPKEGKIEDNDIALIDIKVYEEGKEIYSKENDHIYLGKDYDLYKLSKDIMGMEKGDKKEFEKTFGEKEDEKIKNKTFKLELTIKEVKQEKKPVLNDELAKEIMEDCNTVNELKNKIKENLKQYADSALKQKVLNNTIEKLSNTFKGDIPESMINQQTDMYYNEIIYRVGGDEKRALNLLKMDNLTKESYKEKVKDDAIFDIKKSLILQDIVKKENITVDDNEIEEYADTIAKQYKMEKDKFIKMTKETGKYDILKNELEIQKAYDFLYNNVKIKKGKKINFKDLFQQNI